MGSIIAAFFQSLLREYDPKVQNGMMMLISVKHSRNKRDLRAKGKNFERYVEADLEHN